MARYYFDLSSQVDDLGMELPDDRAGRCVALRYASELIREIDAGSRGQEYWRMDVRKGSDQPLFSLVLELLPARSEQAKGVERGKLASVRR